MNVFDEVSRAKKLRANADGSPAKMKQFGMEEEEFVDVDEFLEAVLGTRDTIQPLQIVQLQAMLKTVRRRLDHVETDTLYGFNCLRKAINDISYVLGPYHVSKALEKRLQDRMIEQATDDSPTSKAHQAAAIKSSMRNQTVGINLKKATKSGKKGEGPKANTDSMAELALIKKEKQEESDRRIWDRFDMFFGIFVVANGVSIGIQVDQDSDERLWTWIDLAFLVIFSVELIFRAILTNQLDNYQDDQVTLGFLPKCSFDRAELGKWLPDTFKNTRNFFKSHWVKFDFFILIVSAVDVFLVQLTSFFTFDAAWISVFRIMRLARLVRMVRLLKSLRELWLLLDGMRSSVNILVWATIMLFLIVYIVGIMCVEMIGSDIEFPLEVRQEWKSVLGSMFRLTQIFTYDTDINGDSWVDMVILVSQHKPWTFGIFIAFVILTSLGLMNLIVGIMVQEAYNIVRDEKAGNRKAAITNAKTSLVDLSSQFASSMDDQHRHTAPEELAKKIKMKVNNLMQVLKENPSMGSSLRSAGITEEKIMQIFAKLGAPGTGEVSLADFMEACLRMTQTMQPLDVIASKVTVMRIAGKLKELNEGIRRFEDLVTHLGKTDFEHIQRGTIKSDNRPLLLNIKKRVDQENDKLEAEITRC